MTQGRLRNLCTAASHAQAWPEEGRFSQSTFSCISKPLISFNFSKCPINRQAVESLVGQGFGMAGDRLSPKLSTENRCSSEKYKQIKHLRTSREAPADADKSVDSWRGLGDKSCWHESAFAGRSYAQNWGTCPAMKNTASVPLENTAKSLSAFNLRAAIAAGAAARASGPGQARRPCASICQQTYPQMTQAFQAGGWVGPPAH